jgi:hypothetical protein
MPDLVRVRLPDGTETNVGASFAASHGLTVLDKAALDRAGRPVREKRQVNRKAAKKTTGDAVAGDPNTGGDSAKS